LLVRSTRRAANRSPHASLRCSGFRVSLPSTRERSYVSGTATTRYGVAQGGGGGIATQGPGSNVSLTNSEVERSDASTYGAGPGFAARGGGIFSSGTVTLASSSTVRFAGAYQYMAQIHGLEWQCSGCRHI